jgi:hypothetical protein
VFLTQVFDLSGATETGWEYAAGGGSGISEQFVQDEAARTRRAVRGGDTASVAAAAAWPTVAPPGLHPESSRNAEWSATASGSTIALVDEATSREIGSLDHGAAITVTRFVPAAESRWLVSGGQDGTLAVWWLRTEDLTREACARLHAALGPDALRILVAATRARRTCEP